MYVVDNEIDKNSFYQGDILINFPFLLIKEKFPILDNGTVKEVGIEDFPEEAGVVIPVKLSNIVILSQSCDAQRREHLIIAPVYKIQDYVDEGILKDSQIESLKKRRILYWFYLPSVGDTFDESVVDFQSIMYYPRLFVEQYKKMKIISMSDWGRHHLGWAINNFFGRPIEDKSN